MAIGNKGIFGVLKMGDLYPLMLFGSWLFFFAVGYLIGKAGRDK
jgi:hypothetical protein